MRLKKIIGPLAFIGLTVIASSASAGKKDYTASITLNFEGTQVCQLAGAKSVEGKAWRKHDEKTLSWSAGCEIELPKGIHHCLLSGQSIEETSAILSWTAKSSDGKLTARIHSEADINPSFGKFQASFFCH